MPPHTHRTAAGITLIETLVALSILSLISIFLFSGLRTSSALWSRYEDRSNQISRIVMAQDLLRDLIEQTYPAMPKTTDGNARVMFEGTAQGMEFITTLPQHVSPGGLHRVRLARDGSDAVTFAWAPPDEDPLAPTTRVGPSASRIKLIEKAREFKLTYYGRQEGEQDRGWHDDWTAQRALPELIKISLKLPDNESAWPPQIIAPQIDIDARCVYDPLTQGCRGR
jgi:general secretion pathway protein J